MHKMEKPKFRVKNLLVWSALSMTVVVLTIVIGLTIFEQSHYKFLNEKLESERQVLVDKGISEIEIAKNLKELEYKIRIINQMKLTHEEDLAHWKGVKIKLSIIVSLSGFFIIGPIFYFMFLLILMAAYRFKSRNEIHA